MSEMVHENDAIAISSHRCDQISSSKGDLTAVSMQREPIADRSRHTRSSLNQLKLNTVSELTAAACEISVVE